MRMRALSMWRPYGFEIARGRKRIETRDQYTGWRGDIAIHSAKRAAPDHAPVWGLPDVKIGPAGAVVAVASLVDCLQIRTKAPAQAQMGERPGSCIIVRADVEPVSMIRGGQAISIVDQLALGDYRPGRYGYVLDAVRPLQEPFPVRGMPGIWTLTEEQTEAVYDLL